MMINFPPKLFGLGPEESQKLIGKATESLPIENADGESWKLSCNLGECGMAVELDSAG